MDLEFTNSSFPYLNCIFQNVQYWEETGEMIVPDSESDMESIIASYANVILRGKECRDGTVTISGGIKGWIVYQPEDHSGPKALKLYLPFSVKSENPLLTQSSSVICSLRAASVDGRMLNSRKATLRVNVSCALACYERTEETLYAPRNMPEQLQVRERTYSLEQPVESSEKSFTISENLEVSQNMPPMVRVFREECRLELNEKKLVANKAVFKGFIHVRLLYGSEDNDFYTYEQQVPYSQYCEFENDYNEQNVDILPVITGYDLDVSEDGQFNSIPLTVNILAQCVVYDKRSLKVLDDAYCIGADLQPQWKEYNFNSQLDESKERRHVRCQLHGDIAQIKDIYVCTDHPTVEQIGDEVKIKTPVSVQLLGSNNAGELTTLYIKTDDVQNFALAETARCCPQTDAVGAATASLFSGGAEVCFDLLTANRFTAPQELRTLCGGEIDCSDKSAEQRPSLILKRMHKDADLWDLAKKNRAKVEDICAANHLHEAMPTENQLLLIPVG